MQRVRLGRTELPVTRVGFGGIPIQRVDPESAHTAIRRTYSLGVRFFDTANGYGTSEERIGRALHDVRSEVILATKTGARTREEAEAHLALSLERLQTDFVDLWQFHNVSTEDDYRQVLGRNGAMEAAQRALEEGTVRHVGITSHSMEIALEAVSSDRFETIQFPFNFVTREAEDRLIPLAAQRDVGFIGMKPFAGGLLDDPNLSIKYVLQWENVVPDPGIETVEDIEQIARLVGGSLTLTASERREIERLRSELGTRFCRRCGYCLPCPEGIRIPTALNVISFARRFTPEQLLQGSVGRAAEKARDCVRCGECETRCPYHLPIREMLVENVEAYESVKAAHSEGGRVGQ